VIEEETTELRKSVGLEHNQRVIGMLPPRVAAPHIFPGNGGVRVGNKRWAITGPLVEMESRGHIHRHSQGPVANICRELITGWLWILQTEPGTPPTNWSRYDKAFANKRSRSRRTTYRGFKLQASDGS
jgi:hypothetical protein